MFERFTPDARETVVSAQREARQLRHRWIGTEHLLLALLSRTDNPTAAVLARHGLTHDAVAEWIASFHGNDLDADALSTLGIDLDAVRDSVEASFGPGALDTPSQGWGCRDRSLSGHLPFSPRAKKVLELALREAIALKQKTITDGHIVLGLVREGEGLAAKVMADRGVDFARLRREITAAALAV